MRIVHRLMVELLRTDGTSFGQSRLHPDWEPAVEWTRLEGLRQHGVWAPESAAERLLEPLWHDRLGEPYVRGFRVHLSSRDGLQWYEDFPIRYLRGVAAAAATALVEDGVFSDGADYLYRALAYAEPRAEVEQDDASFTTVEQSPPLLLRDLPYQALLERSTPRGDSQSADFEVFVPGSVLDEASALTARACDVETGGILIGHLGRQGQGSDICVEVTALLPAMHTAGDSVKLTFTSDTWTDVRRVVELRAREEIVLGWFHSHPQMAWCRDGGCSLDQQQRCTAADGFLSVDDMALHRTMFPRAFTVALVMTHSVKGIVPRLFGWRSGLLEPRGFRVLDERVPDVTPGGASHAGTIACL